MASFGDALDVVLRHEGSRYTDDPHDPGGPTRWGVTLGTLRQIRPGATPSDVARLTREEAEETYRRLWWEPLLLDAVAGQTVAAKIFDLSINLGVPAGVRLLQRALGQLGHPVAIDGVMGPITIAAVNAVNPHSLLLELASLQTAYYRSLIARSPELDRYRRGWLARAAWPFTPSSGVA
jgi:type VI secretion system secreted protein VgrG